MHIPHIKAPLTNLFSFINPHPWNPHPIHPHYLTKKTLLKNISSVISLVVYNDICVLPFHFRVSRSSEMQFGVIYLETWGGIQPLLHSWHLNFALVCYWWNTNGIEFSLLNKPVPVADCGQKVKVGNCSDVGWFCLSWPTQTACKPVDYRYSSLTDCAVSHCVKFLCVTSTVWLSELILIPFPRSLVCNVFSI